MGISVFLLGIFHNFCLHIFVFKCIIFYLIFGCVRFFKYIIFCLIWSQTKMRLGFFFVSFPTENWFQQVFLVAGSKFWRMSLNMQKFGNNYGVCVLNLLHEATTLPILVAITLVKVETWFFQFFGLKGGSLSSLFLVCCL